MTSEKEAPGGPPHPLTHRLSTARLFLILVVFTGLAGYAIWSSERFQNLVQGVSETRISQALGVPVKFRRVDFRILPPSIRLADVRIENDPALTDPALRETPLLTAEELYLGGGVSLVERELRLGRVRALRPRVVLAQLPDGSFNLPPGLKKKAGGGLKLSVAEILAQEGVFEFRGRKIPLDGRVENFALGLRKIAGERYDGTLTAGRAVLDLHEAEPVVLDRFETRFRLLGAAGIAFDSVRASGGFGRLEASGAVEGTSNARALFRVAGEVSIEEVERIFDSTLGFRGRATVRARLEVPPGGAFRVTGEVQSERVDAQGFVLTDLSARVFAHPEALIARIDRGRYAGGEASGVLRIADLDGQKVPITLALEGRGISVETFFSDLDMPGTGLSGLADLQLALSWGRQGIDAADGGGRIAIRAGSAASQVRSRYGLPISGGGPVSVANGSIRFEGAEFRFPRSALTLTGGFRIGEWKPNLDFRLRSEDLAEVDRLFQNLVAATGGRPEPLGIGGTGVVEGHLEGTWADPEVTARMTAEQARYAGIVWGSVRGDVDIRDGAFVFHPLEVSDGAAGVTLEGSAAFRDVPGRPTFDLRIAARRYPLSRLLDYLDLDYPVEGLVTGAFPIAGSPESLTGGGPLELVDADVWGQKFPRLTADVRMTPGRFALREVQATLDGGTIEGEAEIAFREETLTARLTGKDLPLAAFSALEMDPQDLRGRLAFQLEASGSVERPSGRLTASVSDASFFGHTVPPGGEPQLAATLTEGVLDGSVTVPQRWTITARGDVFGDPARVNLSLDAADLANLLIFTPLDVPAGRSGSLALTGQLTLPRAEGSFPTGTFRVTRARLDLPDRPGVLRTQGEVRLLLDQQRLTFGEFRAIGEGTELAIGGYLDVGETSGLNVSVGGRIDAALAAIAIPEIELQGRVLVDLRATGPFANPGLQGSLRIEDGKYRLTQLAQIVDDIDGSVSLQGDRGEIDGLRARFGGGEIFAAGSFRLDRFALADFRVTLQGRRVTMRYPRDMRLQVDADLVASGGPEGNLIRGEIVLLRGTYARDFEVSLANLLERTRPSGAVGAREPWKEETRLEVRIVSSTALEVRNNLASLTATVDLLARGTVADPNLVGQILLDEGGRITFRDVRYEIESGTITFAGGELFAPIVDLRARAEVKGYDLIVNLVGTWPRLQTTFSSDPPLPDDTVIALLLTGSDPGPRTTGDSEGSIVSAAESIVAGAAIGGITRRGQRLFRLDRFEIDPVFTGSQVDVRSTVGKQITPNIFITYSQSLNDPSQEPIFQGEWRITDTVVLRARRDENGVYLLDLRRRQRF
ncbi:MAG: translocation/assembly module TamB domain-containing protein [Thermoanaerobaculia bacterium]